MKNKSESDKLVTKPLSILFIILIGIGIISAILGFLDRENFLIYSQIVFFVAFLFFLIKGIRLIKNGDYKFGIACFTFVVVYITIEILKVLIYIGAF